MKSLNNKTALICGGSKGIGAACVDLFSKTYENVLVFSRTDGTFGARDNVKYYNVDLSDEIKLKKITEAVLEKYQIDVLINNAGGPQLSSSLEVETFDFNKAFSTQLYAFHFLSKQCFNSLKRNKNGRIINIVSVTAKIPLENFCVSNSLRGAILNWSKTLSKEFAPHGITVNNVLPGYTETERLQEVISKRSEEKGVPVEVIKQSLIDQIPIKRFCKPEEVASLAFYLSSEEAAAINGVSIAVDGGWTPCA